MKKLISATFLGLALLFASVLASSAGDVNVNGYSHVSVSRVTGE